MSPVLDAADPAACRAAAAAVDQGRLIVVPTDTVYGIAARLDRPAGLAAIFEAKARPSGMALPVLVSGLDQARALAVLDERAEALAGVFWPGALTIVLARNPSLTATIGGTGGFTKNGDGLATFGTGTKTYAGPTVLNGGRMRISNAAMPSNTGCEGPVDG